MLSCIGGLTADEDWLSAETSAVRNIARDQRDVGECWPSWRYFSLCCDIL